MKKLIATKDIICDALTANPGQFGILLIKQDDIGGHLINLALGNTGSVVLNTLPRAVTRLYWERTDEGAYWDTKILSSGIEPTTIPTIRIDEILQTVEVFHSLPNSEIVMSIQNGPWQPYTGMFSITRADRPAGFWRFKVIEAPGRLQSGISYSLPTHLNRTGFTFILPANLT